MNTKPTKNRRPWNRVSQQIYSLSTLDAQGQINMNIVSYATPATLKPKSYVIAVYRGTKTHQNLFDTGAHKHFLLQGLSMGQIKHVRSLGQKSGLKYDKPRYLAKQDLQYFKYNGNEYGYLPDCAFVLLCKLTRIIKYGDHDLITAEIQKIVADDKSSRLLTTSELIENRIVL